MDVLNIPENSRLLRIPEVSARVGLKKTVIYERIKAGTFPKPIKLGSASAWPEHLVDAWIARQIERQQVAITGTGLSDRYAEALVLARRLHAGQTRKGTSIPYVAHVLAVSSIALEHGADEDEAIAALLHDAVEDCGGAPVLAEIERCFGRRVAGIVAACSDTDITPKPPWQARKEAYLAHLRIASPSVRLVSAADKLHNARSILADLRQFGDALWKRFNASKAQTLWYYRSLVEAFAAHGSSPLVDELARIVAEIERLAEEGGRK